MERPMVCRKRPNERDYDHVSAARSRRILAKSRFQGFRSCGGIQKAEPSLCDIRWRECVRELRSAASVENGRLEKTSIISPIPQSGIMNSHSKPEPSPACRNAGTCPPQAAAGGCRQGFIRWRRPRTGARSTTSLTFRLSFHSVTSIPTSRENPE